MFKNGIALTGLLLALSSSAIEIKFPWIPPETLATLDDPATPATDTEYLYAGIGPAEVQVSCQRQIWSKIAYQPEAGLR